MASSVGQGIFYRGWEDAETSGGMQETISVAQHLIFGELPLTALPLFLGKLYDGGSKKSPFRPC